MIRSITFYAYKAVSKMKRLMRCWFAKICTMTFFYANNVKFGSIKVSGIPHIHIEFGGKLNIGNKVTLNSGFSTITGHIQRCSFELTRNAILNIGDNVGMSGCAICCRNNIIIENNVKIGAGVCIYDTDFHSLNSILRNEDENEIYTSNSAPVILKENCFIGTRSTILKGVTVGINSIVGACSVVTRSIPDNELWAGNPAKFIRKL